ncbi:MAG TPA: LLM class flavin-dependent oxidoreductase [Candidatus Binataceae bacterium]|nr:LLM class flavin-dependent oxidoreductase [Candidatus Binataceae bacterium]
MSDALPLATELRFGAQAWAFDGERARHAIKRLAAAGFDEVWAGDHVSFTGPVNDPLIQVGFLGALEPKLVFATGVYLLALRSPAAVAKMVATVDRLLGAGRFIFGVGVGGEFPREWQACGVPVAERGSRTNEALEVIKRLWNETRVTHRGRHYNFEEVSIDPRPATAGGPPIWIGGRAEPAQRRAAHLGDGWIPYVITSKRYAEGLDFIGREAAQAGRRLERFGSGVFLFCALAENYERAHQLASASLSRRYAMDFGEAARRYGALGTPADVAAKIAEYAAAGARDFVLDAVVDGAREEQLERLAREVIPLVRTRS